MAVQPLQTSSDHGDVVVALVVPVSEAARPLPRWHSVSSTREYERCPRRYCYAYVERLPQDRPVPIPWRVGSAVHAALEAAYQAKRRHADRPLIAGLPEALVALRQSWDTLELPHDDGRYREAGRQVERTLREDVLEVGEVVGVELPLRTSPPTGHRIAGFLDLLLRRDATTLEIVDHKVTARRASSSEIAADLQLNLYGALVRETWPATTTVRATLHYPTGPDLVSATLTDEGMAAARARVERTASLAAADTEFVPRPAAHCDHCPWRQRCPAG
jgi:putative RecB family exonuclease